MSDFPVSPENLTAEWLSEVLGHTIQGFQVNYFSEGSGVIGQVTRIDLQSESGPNSIIAKFPSPVADNRGVAEAYDMYGREVHFYQDIAETLTLRTPACYYAAFEPSSHDFVLLLEDLQRLRIGNQVAGCSLADARAVVDTIAELHAGTWEPTHLGGVMSHNSPMQRDGMIGGFQMGWPVVVDQFGDLIPANAQGAGDAMPAAIGGLLEAMCTDPVCFTHADVRLDNIFFGDDEVIFVDWQSICTSAPEQDLAYFLTQSVPPEVRAQEDLVARYHSALCAHGIDYELDRCRERYRLCALYLLSYAVVIAGTLDMGNERGKALARTLLGNSLSALDEMNAFDLLKNRG